MSLLSGDWRLRRGRPGPVAIVSGFKVPDRVMVQDRARAGRFDGEVCLTRRAQAALQSSRLQFPDIPTYAVPSIASIASAQLRSVSCQTMISRSAATATDTFGGDIGIRDGRI